MTASKTRIYLVTPTSTVDGDRLVQAANAAQALAHVARTTLTVRVASQADVFNAARAGVALEVAGRQQEGDDDGNG